MKRLVLAVSLLPLIWTSAGVAVQTSCIGDCRATGSVTVDSVIY
ncbi:MAG TPA: hypothetical protein VEB21_08840 [Terriglobales bacterium]|nr:hypothetical protein [Terriglobales bacterium]